MPTSDASIHLCLTNIYSLLFDKYISTHPKVMDGVICLVQPPTETIVNPAAVRIPYSDLASDGSSKYSETVSFPASQDNDDDDDDDDEETLSAATGRDPEGPTEVCILNIMYSY